MLLNENMVGKQNSVYSPQKAYFYCLIHCILSQYVTNVKIMVYINCPVCSLTDPTTEIKIEKVCRVVYIAIILNKIILLLFC